MKKLLLLIPCKDNPILFVCQFRNLLEEKCNKDINY